MARLVPSDWGDVRAAPIAFFAKRAPIAESVSL